MFAPDDLVVYPAQGVGKIERIDRQNIGGIACEFYIVRIRANNITLMVPVNNAANVGLRTLTPEADAQGMRELLLISRSKELSFGERRLQEQAMGLVTGELAEVLHLTEDSLREELLERYAPPPQAEAAAN